MDNDAPLPVQTDYDISGLIDQVVIALFSQHSAPRLREAAVGILSDLDTQFGLAPSQVIGDRLQEPHIAFPNLSLFYKSSAQAVRTSLRTHMACVPPPHATSSRWRHTRHGDFNTAAEGGCHRHL